MDEGGQINSGYLVYLVVAAVLCASWSLGIPGYFGYKLYKHRAVIADGNSACFAGIAPLRPLFMFFKPNCYFFEVFFMVEKLILTGVVRALRVYVGGFFVANTIALTVVIFVLCTVVKHRPSKTDPYNTANIFSHVSIICMLVSTSILNFPTAGTADDFITPFRVGMFLAIIQMPFWAYLIVVSFRNL
eukprot:SAG31_NODE_18693_length_626_cov_1.250474_1_plen_187_part_10